MKKVILAAVLTLTMGSAVALAYNQNDLNPNNDQGQAKAAADCVEVIIDQLIRGQTGATGVRTIPNNPIPLSQIATNFGTEHFDFGPVEAEARLTRVA
ncbi:MAG: hypothetical protein EOS23_26055 [Mesorhizobium sp.]|uniref:hypothetical protein n=1 Tax=unclassified Mesorhizobium TaxID=325217 RepID=UPI000FD428BB|nr:MULTISPECIES: hypothetical protein [unclassified Mesorhizobium]RUV85961.1 hypothetical protein EOA88_15625 [Mesorhizobium sp. M5C.F.Ca.IN.020.14.1.1]RUV31870.1 hypothetical protein EOA86_04785 [Mesorhizobium sp. M5C.F.Ca.IN.020.32.2.1]RWD51748.1 MAG: hypothetical protein EOS59_05210 [Mesorhizobium sp.]RWE07919.1 MAG: hypothetical protein EOS23_26055 [Mesorhizobium sp.]RWE61526.1 MAG: hypothetical protein EOS24_11265 [Mesorhizobium sp.]